MGRKRILDDARIKKLYQEGIPPKDLAKMYGVSRQSIHRALRRDEKPTKNQLKDSGRQLCLRIQEQLPVTKRSKRSKEARLLQECYTHIMRTL